MNERAFDFALEVLKDQPTLETWTFNRTELEQFVELIVKDCASVVDGVYKAGGNTYSNLIYERFGIKYDWQK